MSDTGTIALVTGASRGIGRAIATELGKQGLIVVGTATTEQGAASISEYLQTAGVTGKGYCADVSSQESVSSLLSSIEEEFCRPTVLVNNAGITRDNLLMRMKEDEWNAVIETNLGAMYRVCKACVKGMTKARWGRIVNISSVVGSSGNAGQSNYAASKAGIEGFSRALAKEIGSRGITVNAVAPGFIDTDMTRELSEKQTEALLSQIPLGRLGQAEEIAAVVGFLVSDSGGYITGETLHVNGGMYMT
ncbi:MAG: 3-oxoacyl-ACP reductase FabG [Gammaproteobacteria bacterium]|jgi:3-oxoacyl-[acyl-carrier protein] reductase|nr:3-oxoacyl-ACP reductase FabG [Gammaproteobacteria bacterium]